jgi:hypothetical protein
VRFISPSETKFPYRSVHRSYRRQEVCLQHNELRACRPPPANSGKRPADRLF